MMRASETRHAQALLRIMNAVPIPHPVPDSNPDLAPSPERRQRQDKNVFKNKITKVSFCGEDVI